MSLKTFSLVLAVAGLNACSPKSEGPASVAATDAWCRVAPSTARAGGCYVTLTATTKDRLTAVETSAAERAEIHTMSMDRDVMRMRELEDGLELPRGQPVALKPGAEHLMLIGPRQPLTAGGAVPLTLRFEKAPPVTVEAPVRAAAPMG